MIREVSTRQLEIIQAAGRILTRSGVSGLTIKNLAQEMEFSEAAIYRHFTGKEEIIVAMLNYLSDTMDSTFGRVILTEDDPEKKLTTLFQSQFSFFKKNPHFVVAVFSDGLMEESARVNEAIINIMSIKRMHLLPIIKEGQQKGYFTNDISAADLAHIIMGGFRLHMFKWRAGDFKSDLKKNGNHIMRAMLTLIRTK